MSTSTIKEDLPLKKLSSSAISNAPMAKSFTFKEVMFSAKKVDSNKSGSKKLDTQKNDYIAERFSSSQEKNLKNIKANVNAKGEKNINHQHKIEAKSANQVSNTNQIGGNANFKSNEKLISAKSTTIEKNDLDSAAIINTESNLLADPNKIVNIELIDELSSLVNLESANLDIIDKDKSSINANLISDDQNEEISNIISSELEIHSDKDLDSNAKLVISSDKLEFHPVTELQNPVSDIELTINDNEKITKQDKDDDQKVIDYNDEANNLAFPVLSISSNDFNDIQNFQINENRINNTQINNTWANENLNFKNFANADENYQIEKTDLNLNVEQNKNLNEQSVLNQNIVESNDIDSTKIKVQSTPQEVALQSSTILQNETFNPNDQQNFKRDQQNTENLDDSLNLGEATIGSDGKLSLSFKEAATKYLENIPHRADQISLAVKAGLQNGKKEISLSMYPETLGSVDVEIEFNKDQVVSIKIFAEKPETLKILIKDIATLEKSLAEVVKADDASLSFNLKDGQNGNEYQPADRQTIKSLANNSENLTIVKNYQINISSDPDGVDIRV